MKTLMFAAVLSTAAGLMACLPAPSASTTETRAVSGFTKVRSEGPLDVTVHEGTAFNVTVTEAGNYQKYVTTEVQGDTLVIGWKDGSFTLTGPSSAEDEHTDVTLPDLVAAANDGSGNLTIEDLSHSDVSSLESSGSGDMTFNGAASAMTISLSGSGAVKAEGSAPSLDLALSGSGELDTSGLVASSGSIDSSGSGSLTGHYDDGAVNVRLSGSGDITVHGSSQVNVVSRSGSGVVHHD